MHHKSYEELEAAWQALEPGPKEVGRVILLVARASASAMPKGQDKRSSPIHATPERVAFTVEDGLEGDRWKAGKDVESQISITSVTVARLVAGTEDRLHLFGNNLVVDMDLCAETLPVGTKLRLGTGEIEISAALHEPCDRYEARFGTQAHDWVKDEKFKSRHLRGRMSRVTQGGEVAIGDVIAIVR